MAAKRHHSSHKRHISAHDRAVDRENLMGGHGYGRSHSSHHSDIGKYGYGEGGERHNQGHNDMEGRRTEEMEHAGMIREDHRAIANLPQEVMIKPYPMERDYMPEEMDDTIGGVDHQMFVGDNAKRSGGMKPRKV